MTSISPSLRRGLVRAAQIAVTFVVFAVCNAIAVYFEVESGVSILFPATAISILACMYFGVWAAIGVVLATIATPWNASVTPQQLVISGLLSAAEGLIPYYLFRFRRDLTSDLRDMKSLVAFLLFGTIVNSAVSAIGGNLFVVKHPPGVTIVWREVFVWFIADFTAALLIATPLLAFGGAFLRGRDSEERPRTITNALQIVTVIILLGFAASFAIRTYLLNHLEEERLRQHETWRETEETLERLHDNLLRAALIDRGGPAGAMRLDVARRANETLIESITPMLDATLASRFTRIAQATRSWFAKEDSSAHAIGREVLALRGEMDRLSAEQLGTYAAKRQKMMIVAGITDAIVFVILVLASAILLFTISRPFVQLRSAIRTIREGELVDASSIDGRYLEFKSIADTLEETARELRHREEELRQQTEKAVGASRAKSEFLAKMSHELRTPLNSIIGFSDLLTDQEETITRTKRLAFLQNVSGSARHLLGLINDLLDLAKIESGKLKLHLEDLDLRMSIRNTVASTQALFVRKKQDVEVVMPDEPMQMRGDAGRIEQILLNLLSNANKFSPEGDRITIRGDADEAMWRIEVTDHGIGIREEDQQRIFDEFQQVQTRGAPAIGTGLGLALARRFAEAHGGDITVASGLGTGAVFRVRLPRM
jgi:signal transduction histidine kinase/integral membrane sensor domain MASE1